MPLAVPPAPEELLRAYARAEWRRFCCLVMRLEAEKGLSLDEDLVELEGLLDAWEKAMEVTYCPAPWEGVLKRARAVLRAAGRPAR